MLYFPVKQSCLLNVCYQPPAPNSCKQNWIPYLLEVYNRKYLTGREAATQLRQRKLQNSAQQYFILFIYFFCRYVIGETKTLSLKL